jgi:hypothetical protein
LKRGINNLFRFISHKGAEDAKKKKRKKTEFLRFPLTSLETYPASKLLGAGRASWREIFGGKFFIFLLNKPHFFCQKPLSA